MGDQVANSDVGRSSTSVAATSAHPFNRKTCAAFLGFAKGGAVGGGRSLSGCGLHVCVCGPRFWPELVYRRSDSNGRRRLLCKAGGGEVSVIYTHTYVAPMCAIEKAAFGAEVVRGRKHQRRLRF